MPGSAISPTAALTVLPVGVSRQKNRIFRTVDSSIACPAMPKYSLVILLLVCCTIGKAQPFQEKDFIRYTVKDGMVDNNVNCLQQDEWGYIWLGTDAGLNRFDGHAFHNLSLSSGNLPLLSAKIRQIKKFGPHRLGIVSHGGFQLLNTEQLSSQDYLVADTTPFTLYRNEAWDAIQLHGDSYAVTTAAGFYVFSEPGKLSFREEKYSIADMGDKRILYGRDIFRISDKEYLLYAEENKIALYNADERKFREIDPSEKQWKAFYTPTSPGEGLLGSKYQLDTQAFLFVDLQKNKIVYYDHRLRKSVESRFPFDANKELNWESRITILDSGRFAINCSNFGFYVFHLDPATDSISFLPEKFLPAQQINCLFFDKERRLWAGTTDGLLQQRLKHPLLRIYPIEPATEKSNYAEFLSCAYRHKDKLYVGHYSRSSGLTILDAATMKSLGQMQFYGKDNMWNEVMSIQCYYADTLWLGTNGGILWFDTKTRHYGDAISGLRDIPPALLNKIKYKTLDAKRMLLSAAGKDGYAWMTSVLHGVVARYAIASRKLSVFTPDTKPAIPFRKVKQAVYDSDGDVWITGHSLARWNSGRQVFDTLINVYGGPRKFNSNILAVSAGDSGNLWLHNEENGLLEYRVRERQFRAYGAGNGLPSAVFESFSPVVDHHLWMANSTTLTAFDTRSKRSVVYDYSDGLSSYKPTSRRIYYDSASRSFYLFCGNDLVNFPVRPIPETWFRSAIFIESLQADNGPILAQPRDGMQFTPNTNSLAIDFTIVDFETANSYKFAYKLNQAAGWTDLGHARRLTLDGLSPGNYQVQLMATDRSGLQKTREFGFVILPHFWQTLWFVLLLVIAGATLLYLLYRSRIRQVRQKANIDKQLAQMEMKALHAQMNPHFIFNSLNSIKQMMLNEQNNEASDYLTKFAQMIRITLDQSVHTFVTLRSTVDYLHRYIEMEKIRNSYFLFSMTVDAALDVNETVLPPMLIQPFIENSIWHGIVPPRKAIHIQVTFTRIADRLICTVADDGVGIDRSTAEKIAKGSVRQAYGIENVRERIRLLNEKYNLQSKVNIIDKHTSGSAATGTVVTLELQLQHLNE
jgi:ligand-binding sensor domain-containing protein